MGISTTAAADGQQTPKPLLFTLERLLAIDAPTVAGALDAASGLLSEALGADKVDTSLYDPATDSLVADGTSDTPMGRRQRAIGMDRLPLANGGRVVEVFQTGVPYHTGRADRDPGVLAGFTTGLGVRSVFAVPLEVGGQRRGVLHAMDARPDFFGEQDRPFLTAVAHWIGLVIQRAELTERHTAEATERGRLLAADEVVTVLAHDLRNYLTPIKGRLDLIRARATREGRPTDRRDAEAADAALGRLGRLVRDLLDTSRLERGLFTIDPRPLDLAALARDTALALGTGAPPIRVEAPAQLCVYGDPSRLRQVLENLLANAVRHSPLDATVDVAVGRETGADRPQAVIIVSDRGPGIAPEVLPRIFERFVRGEGSNGLGLGLYLARRIVAAHGGALTAESSPGAGTRFRLTLPADEPADEERGEHRRIGAPGDGPATTPPGSDAPAR